MDLNENMSSVLRDFEHPRGGVHERIEQDIRRNRMGWGRFVLTDNEGKPVRNAKITLRQTKHEFMFGCNLFKLRDFESEKKNEAYEKLFRKVFNNATVPFYWDTLEPEPGKLRFLKTSPVIARRPPTDLAVDWCLENGIRAKGHWLFCDNFVPRWLPQNSRELMILLEKRIARLGERYGGKVTLWDGVNEAFSYPRWFHPNIGGSVVPEDYVFQVFKLAEKYFPNYTEFCYNDGQGAAFMDFHYSNAPMYLLCRDLLQRGARLGGFGMQYHMFGRFEDFAVGKCGHPFFDPYYLFQVLDQYSKLGLPMHMTEISLPAYPELPEKTAREFQAKMVRHLFRLWFSQDRMESIVWWNFADNTAYGPENVFRAGLLDKDLSPKPAYETVDELVNHEWHTECVVSTDENGIADWNGYYGDYDMIIAAGRTRKKLKTTLSKHSHNEYRMTL